MLKILKKHIIQSKEFVQNLVKSMPKPTSWLSIVFAALILALCFTGYLFWLIFVMAAFGCISLCGLLISFFSKCDCEIKNNVSGSDKCCCKGGRQCKCGNIENDEPDFKI